MTVSLLRWCYVLAGAEREIEYSARSTNRTAFSQETEGVFPQRQPSSDFPRQAAIQGRTQERAA
jgi:hypothetical protein